MDQKKQDLNPELKSIYEKVMNTQIKPQSPQATDPAPQNPIPQPPPVQGVNPSPLPAQPIQPNVAQAPIPTQGAQPQPQVGTQMAQPHAVNPNQPFVFSGNKVNSPASKGGGGMSGKIILVLVLVLVAAWGALWAKVFELF